jgi:hypothetical protein
MNLSMLNVASILLAKANEKAKLGLAGAGNQVRRSSRNMEVAPEIFPNEALFLF